MRSLGPLAALLVLLAAAPAGAQPKTAIEKGSTVKIDYTLKDDKGEVLDSSTGKEPLAFKQGAQQIIPGLDRALLGMKVGDSKKVVVKPEEAYGKVDPKAEAEVPKEALPEGAAVVGTRLMARGQDGNPHPVTVKVVRDKTVVLDLNHPLAGKTLVFDIKVVSIEPPGAAPAPAPVPAPAPAPPTAPK
jgi:FKBP-type peptidyl-prolyl cis-trans isomerase SlyD